MTELVLKLNELFNDSAERRRVGALLRDSGDVDDVLQDLAERLLKRTPAPSSPRSYLRKAARNSAHNTRRSDEVRAAYEAEYASLRNDAQLSVESQIEASDAVQALHRVLGELPKITRTLFLQHYQIGHSQVVLAQLHGLHLSTIEKQLAKAKRHCFARLIDYLE